MHNWKICKRGTGINKVIDTFVFHNFRDDGKVRDVP